MYDESESINSEDPCSHLAMSGFLFTWLSSLDIDLSDSPGPVLVSSAVEAVSRFERSTHFPVHLSVSKVVSDQC